MIYLRMRLGVTLLVIIPLMSGCGQDEPQAQAPPSIQDQSESQISNSSHAGFPLDIIDGLNRRVSLPSPPGRIISLAPKNTELLFAVGAGDRVVGVTTYCNVPQEAARRPKIGGFSPSSINLEKIVSLKPDLVAAVGEIQGPIIEQLERLQIPVVALAAESLSDLYGEIELLGQVVGHPQRALRMVRRLERRVADIHEQTRHIALEQRVTVFYQVWDEPLTAAGPGSFIGELIEFAGGTNIIANRSASYPQISEEILLNADPDVIMTSSRHSAPVNIDRILEKPSWSGLQAVRNRRIQIIDGDLVSRCGPRLVDALEIMAHALYPEQFDAHTTGRQTQASSDQGFVND